MSTSRRFYSYFPLSSVSFFFLFFFFNDTATTEIYTLSLHDALPISASRNSRSRRSSCPTPSACRRSKRSRSPTRRSEEHTSELQSRFDLVCRLLLEKKKKKKQNTKNREEKNNISIFNLKIYI